MKKGQIMLLDLVLCVNYGFSINTLILSILVPILFEFWNFSLNPVIIVKSIWLIDVISPVLYVML